MDLENIVVDITQRNYNTIQTIQYDVDSRYVNVKIVSSGKNVDLTNYMVSIACKKPDGKIVFNETEMVEPKQGLIKFLISEQITTALGEVVCELKIYGKNSSVLTTQYFTINVTQPIADKAIQSTNEFRQLTIAMNEYNDWIDKIEEKYNGLEEEYAEELSKATSTINDKLLDVNFMPPANVPSKTFVTENDYKVVIKENDNKLKIFQKANKFYLEYTLTQKSGDTGSSSYGGNWDLLRVVGVRESRQSYVYFKPTPVTGNLYDKQVASGELNAVEKQLFGLKEDYVDTTKNYTCGGEGLDISIVNPSESFSFHFPLSSSTIANIMFLGSNLSSESVDISIVYKDEEITIDNFNPRIYMNYDKNGCYSIRDFRLPVASEGNQSVLLKITNKSSSRPFYFGCMNLFRLEDYRGQSINAFKSIGGKRIFIDAVGASDYALNDGGKWFGSFHGGEVSSYNKISLGKEDSEAEYDFSTVSVGGLNVSKNLKIRQRTKLLNSITMITEYNWSSNGTMDMKFSFDNRTKNIKLTNFYTALTCTHKDFNYLSYPQLVATPTNGGDIKIYSDTGEVHQQNSNDFLELIIRHTKFNEEFSGVSYIRPNNSYSKYYYGVIAESESVELKTLTFSKSLDFIFRS